MKGSASIFRLLVVLGTLTYLGWFFLPYGMHLRPGQVATITNYHGYGAVLPFTWLIDGPLFLLWLFSAAGLFCFQNWARHLFLTLNVTGFIRVALGGIAVSPGFDAMLTNVLAVMDGAILALAYISPLSEYFERPRRTR